MKNSTENFLTGFNGTQGMAIKIKGTLVKAGSLMFRWTDNSGIGKARAFDLVFIAVFNRESKRWMYVVDAARRSAQHCNLQVSPFRFKKVRTYFGLISEYGTRISTSVYVGEVHVS